MSEPVNGYEILEHTADLAIRGEAEILPDLYCFLATAMFECMTDIEQINLVRGERIEVTGRDLEDILIRMLSELLYRFNTHSIIYREFIIEYLTHEKLIVYARGENIDPERHEIKMEIKAPTYHNVEITTTDHGYSVTVIFDV